MVVEPSSEGSASVPCCDVCSAQIATIGGENSVNIHVSSKMVSPSLCNETSKHPDVPSDIPGVDVEIVVAQTCNIERGIVVETIRNIEATDWWKNLIRGHAFDTSLYTIYVYTQVSSSCGDGYMRVPINRKAIACVASIVP